MRKLNNAFLDFAYLLYRWITPIVDPIKLIRGPINYWWYFRDWFKYSRKDSAEPINLFNTYPCLYDKTPITEISRHYLYQDTWAFKKIIESGARYHIDVGSRIGLVSFLSTITKVTFIDIRSLEVMLENLDSKKGSILSMPYEKDSVASLSCLHVAEHIGLGRYGDSLDPLGTKKAAEELSRILAKNGNLYFSLPIGKPRLCFNVHRIHNTQQILDYFSALKLIELSGIDDDGFFKKNIDRHYLDSCNYGCGLFWFTKK